MSPPVGERMLHPTLDRFLVEIREIAPDSAESISPESDLIEDLRFDPPAFRRLAVLLFERYGIGGLSTASMRTEAHLTVESFFRHCVLEALGLPDMEIVSD